MVKSGEDASSMIRNAKEKKQLVAKKEAEVEAAETARKSRLELIGNLVPDSVPVSNDEVSIDFVLFCPKLQIHVNCETVISSSF